MLACNTWDLHMHHICQARFLNVFFSLHKHLYVNDIVTSQKGAMLSSSPIHSCHMPVLNNKVVCACSNTTTPTSSTTSSTISTMATTNTNNTTSSSR